MDVPSRSSRSRRVGLFFLVLLAATLSPLLADPQPLKASLATDLATELPPSPSMIRSGYVWVGAAILMVATTIFAIRRTLRRG